MSTVLERLQSGDDCFTVDTHQELRQVATESLFFEPHIADSLFLQLDDFISSTFLKIRESSPPPAVVATLARVSLFPHWRIAIYSIDALVRVLQRTPSTLTLLLSPIFPSSSPHQQYSGLSFLAALPSKLRTVFTELQTKLLTDPSHLPKYTQLPKSDQFRVNLSLDFCDYSIRIPLLLLDATPPIEVDSEIIREMTLIVKEGLTTILTTISNIDNLSASVPTHSSPDTQLVSGVDVKMADSLHHLRNTCEDFAKEGWLFLKVVSNTTQVHMSSFQTIILDDPSFPVLILNSLKLTHKDIRENIIHAIRRIAIHYEPMRKQFMTSNLVGRMFEIIDFDTFPLSESNTLFKLTTFIAWMMEPIGYSEEQPCWEQYPLIRDSVFEPAKEFIKSMFRKSDMLILDQDDNKLFEICLYLTHHHIKNMELLSDELDDDIVSEFVKWEVRTMAQMEDDLHFIDIFESMIRRIREWTENKPERLKRREVLLREEGWDDAFELRVVGMGVDTKPKLKTLAMRFRLFCLSRPHTEALLFAPPTSFPLSDAFTPRYSLELGDWDHMKAPPQSICVQAGCCVVLQSRSDNLSTNRNIDLTMLGIPFAGCLVNALHSTTTLPHSFHFFSPELCGLSQQPSVWNDNRQPSALAALTTLADITHTLVFSIHSWQPKMSQADEERRDITFVHVFPFLPDESQTQLLSSFNTFIRSQILNAHRSLDRVVECLVEMTTANPFHTPIALLTEMRKVAELLFYINPATHSVEATPSYVSPFEMSIVEKLEATEGEERCKLLTQMTVVSRDSPDIANELMKAENDAQALLVFSLPAIRSTPTLDLHLDSNPAAFDRVVELAGHINNHPLVSAALSHIGADLGRLLVSPSTKTWLSIGQRHALSELVLDTFRAMSVLRGEGVEEGCTVGRDEMTSQIVDSCLKILRDLMSTESFDPTPFVDSLVALAVTTDLSLLRSILVVLQEIEERTRNTTTPFSISAASAPFRGIHESSVTQQPLPTIISSILLSANLGEFQILAQQNYSLTPSGFSRTPPHNDASISLSLFLRGLDENLVSDIAKETSKTVCLVLEERKASSSRALKFDDSFEISFAQKVRHITPQQLFLTLHKMLLLDISIPIPASTLLPLAPFLTRILRIVVPSSLDRVESSEEDEHTQLLISFHSLLLSLIKGSTPSTLSTPPLSSLLSVLSIALVRLDTIPSSLHLYSSFNDLFRLSENRFNPKLRRVVLILTEEGMEDRSDVALDSFSLDFLNLWKGANAQRNVDPTFREWFAARAQPRLPIHHHVPMLALPFRQQQNHHPAAFNIHPFDMLDAPVDQPPNHQPVPFNLHPFDVFDGLRLPEIGRVLRPQFQPGGFGGGFIPLVPDNTHPDQTTSGGRFGDHSSH
ncbi:hypothetical protein BLNAU_18463 [Blattamonas nauphoetae]|uniref:Uncharacterized protein n=1 Tax=Blattamonas nauphoetae TaxID=2049346 RepID=A0ABQ9X4L4_9EUKA|nr:hypothetical protein BLNAU_18463 [Blattamonas nauphoetae]